MIRWLYRCLLRLHPVSFREQFASEMLSIFDEAACGGIALALFADGFTSLARQWVFRTGMWKGMAGCASAFVLISAMVGMAALPAHRGRFLGAEIDPLAVPARHFPVSPAQFNGHWTGYFQFPGPAGQMEFTLAQTDGVWSGELWVRGADGIMHPGVPENIRVAGDSLSFRFQSNHGEMIYRGRMIDGKLRGYVRAVVPY